MWLSFSLYMLNAFFVIFVIFKDLFVCIWCTSLFARNKMPRLFFCNNIFIWIFIYKRFVSSCSFDIFKAIIFLSFVFKWWYWFGWWLVFDVAIVVIYLWALFVRRSVVVKGYKDNQIIFYLLMVTEDDDVGWLLSLLEVAKVPEIYTTSINALFLVMNVFFFIIFIILADNLVQI